MSSLKLDKGTNPRDMRNAGILFIILSVMVGLFFGYLIDTSIMIASGLFLVGFLMVLAGAGASE
jgi:F0F1-type ATP synthase assembly protein I